MAMDKDSNGYTYGFALVLVIVVGAILAFLSTSLKPLQEKNLDDKKRVDILGAINIESSRKTAKDLYEEYVQRSLVININGEIVYTNKEGDSIKAFDVDIQKQFRDTKLTDDDKRYPLYICKVGGEEYFVIPMVGKGLWGPIWGYVAIKKDGNTVYGAKFDHKTETPGLGAEIKGAKFQAQFPNKTIHEGSKLVSINVKKGGGTKNDPHAVDAITGGTITSDGVNKMLKETFEIYDPYIQSVVNQKD